MMIQLNPMIQVWTHKGEGYAFLVTDYSQEHNTLYTVMLDSGEVWTFPQSEIRGCKNWLMERREEDILKNVLGKKPDEMGY